jgi:hypothetical protein
MSCLCVGLAGFVVLVPDVPFPDSLDLEPSLLAQLADDKSESSVRTVSFGIVGTGTVCIACCSNSSRLVFDTESRCRRRCTSLCVTVFGF